jgi:3-deoxy-manno-octulosonate cytidylyltransferase (CMP-KDO synthetase)
VLAKETGKYLVQHVWEAVVDCPSVSRVILATDSEEVLAAARSFGADVRLTRPDHPSGTDRVAEVAAILDENLVINVQGDEPLIAHHDIQLLVDLFDAGGADSPVMTTLALRRTDREGFGDPNIVKAVFTASGRALYFSRAPVPYGERVGAPAAPGTESAPECWWQHIGVYAYRRDFLVALAKLPPTAIEKRERLEQLRVLEHGYFLRVGETRGRHLGIDTEEEYRNFVREYRERRIGSGSGSGRGSGRGGD